MTKIEMGVCREMPRYKCHKVVHALKIAKVEQSPGNSIILITPAEEGYGSFPVSSEWVARYKPAVGGYYVVYDDGYSSFSPAKAFEDGYTRI